MLIFFSCGFVSFASYVYFCLSCPGPRVFVSCPSGFVVFFFFFVASQCCLLIYGAFWLVQVGFIIIRKPRFFLVEKNKRRERERKREMIWWNETNPTKKEQIITPITPGWITPATISFILYRTRMFVCSRNIAGSYWVWRRSKGESNFKTENAVKEHRRNKFRNKFWDMLILIY